ncbi:MAG: DNA repair protein RecO [Desulfofustis sp.]|jgi:DNA repair protein RecO (recombination protein O)|nr:DNA repair protein RecO [Desulfofustis sp.]
MPTLCAAVPAVVLDCLDHGESDKIVTFFCRDIGKLSAIAKGAPRSKKRFVNKLELFSFLQITCSQSAPDRLAVLTEADLINGFIGLRQSFTAYQAASIVRECILLASGEKQRDDQLFQLLLWTLHALNNRDGQKAVIALFLIKLFDCIGYRPDFSLCQRCSTPWPSGQQGLFSPLTGGLICPACLAVAEAGGRRLSAGTIQTIAMVQRQPPTRLNRCKIGRAVLTETLDCMHQYGRHLFQRELTSWKWLPPD